MTITHVAIERAVRITCERTSLFYDFITIQQKQRILNDKFYFFQICELVQKNRFTETIIDLGLLEPSNILQCQIEEDVVFDSNQIKQNYYKTSKV